VGNGGSGAVKILIVSHYFPPHVGGIEYVAQNQAKYLAKAGNDITVLTSAIGAPKGSEVKDGYTIQRIVASNLIENKSGVPFPIFSPKLFTKAYSLVKNTDIVHIHDAFYISSFTATFWAWVLRKPVVLNQHVAMVPHPSKSVNFIQKVVYGTSGKFIFHKSARIIILNSDVKDFLINKGVKENKMVFIPNGVDTALYHPATATERKEIRKKYNLPPDTPLVLFVGRFVPKKGFDILLKSGGKNYKILFVGGDKPNDQVDDNSYIFLGSKSPKETAEIYRACNIFALPSKGEGFPLSIQEAMSSGLPIITSKAKGYNLYEFNDNLFSMVKPTPENITTRITKILSDKKLRNDMGEYSLSYALKYFDWNVEVRQIQELYGATV